MRLVKIAILFGVSSGFVSSAANAEFKSGLPREPNGIELLLGVGGGYDDTAYESEETLKEASAAIALFTKNFYVDIHEISYQFNVKDDITLKLYGSQDDLPNPEDVSPAFDIKSGDSFDVGLKVKKSFNDIYLSADLNADVTGTHSGYSMGLSTGYSIKHTDKHKFGVEVGVNYQDKERSNYYFGVAADEATEDLMAYTADEVVSVFAEIGYASSFNKNLGFLVSVGATSLADSLQDSPRISSDADLAEVEGSFLLIWQFSAYGS